MLLLYKFEHEQWKPAQNARLPGRHLNEIKQWNVLKAKLSARVKRTYKISQHKLRFYVWLLTFDPLQVSAHINFIPERGDLSLSLAQHAGNTSTYPPSPARLLLQSQYFDFEKPHF